MADSPNPRGTRHVSRYALYDAHTGVLCGYAPAAEAEALIRAGQALLDAEDGVLYQPAPRVAGLPQLRRRRAAQQPLARATPVRIYDSVSYTDTSRRVSRHHARQHHRNGEGLLDEALGILWRPHPGVTVETMRQQWAAADPRMRAWMEHALRAVTEVATDDLATVLTVAIECLQIALDRLNRGQNPRIAFREPPVPDLDRQFWRRLMDLLLRTDPAALPRVTGPHPGLGRQRSPATAVGADLTDILNQHWMLALATENPNPLPYAASVRAVAAAVGCPPLAAAQAARALFGRADYTVDTVLDRWDQHRLQTLLTALLTLAHTTSPVS